MAASLHPPARVQARELDSVRTLRTTNLPYLRTPQLYCIDTRSSIEATGTPNYDALTTSEHRGHRSRLAAEKLAHLLGYCALLLHFHPKAQASRMGLGA